jgi:hypothetical protein
MLEALGVFVIIVIVCVLGAWMIAHKPNNRWRDEFTGAIPVRPMLLKLLRFFTPTENVINETQKKEKEV